MAFLWNYIANALDYFNIGSYFSSSQPASVLFLGLDNAGKSTLFNLLKTGRFDSLEPTKYERHDELVMNGVTFTAYDVGGHLAMRRVWQDYCVAISAVVFLIDSAEPERFHEAKKELNALLSATCLKEVPFLILGNKTDKETAVREKMLKQCLGISHTTGKNSKPKHDDNMRPLEVFMCSLHRRTGFAEGLKWLSQSL
eukprot:244888_1